MAPTLNQKLQIKPGKRLLVLNASSHSLRLLKAGLKGVEVVTQARGKNEAILTFVVSLSEVNRLGPGTFRRLVADGLAWIAYPKGTSEITTDVNRDLLWKALKPTGWRPVRIIALDATWSALRFRPSKLVKS
jgi:hypothetical protein